RGAASAQIRFAVAVHVRHADRSEVAIDVPTVGIAELRTRDRLAEAVAVREVTVEALRVAGARVQLAVAVHVREPDRAPVALLAPTLVVAPGGPADLGREAVAVALPALESGAA